MNSIQRKLVNYLIGALVICYAPLTLPSCKSSLVSEPIVPQARYNLKFSALAKSWDEAMAGLLLQALLIQSSLMKLKMCYYMNFMQSRLFQVLTGKCEFTTQNKN